MRDVGGGATKNVLQVSESWESDSDACSVRGPDLVPGKI